MFLPRRRSDGAPLDDWGNVIWRLYDPAYSCCHCDVPMEHLITYNPNKEISQLRFKRLNSNRILIDRRTMVVHIDGACRNNGRPGAQASWGVYFGSGSCYNSWGRLDRGEPQTSSRAEIEALGQAMNIIRDVCADDPSLSLVIIVCDSQYLVKAMTMWIYDWIENDGRRITDGRPVAHFDLLLLIHELIQEMEDCDCDVQFWSVPREMNTNADSLANRALLGPRS